MIKSKQHYLDVLNEEINKYYDEYLEENGTDKNFDGMEGIVTAEAIVGYYIETYGEKALEMWEENLKYARCKWTTDEEVSRILNELYN